MKKAIILFSGGLDSTVLLAQALEKGRECVALSFDYGQQHRVELEAAKEIAAYYNVPHKIIPIQNDAFSISGLCGAEALPQNRTLEEIEREGIPPSYVPARNTLFFAFALGIAEKEGASEIYYGANLLDHLPYPDCRPGYFAAMQEIANQATKQAVEGHPPTICAPLLYMDKRAIVEEAVRLNVPIEKTFSCYQPSREGEPCGVCDACGLRLAVLV